MASSQVRTQRLEAVEQGELIFPTKRAWEIKRYLQINWAMQSSSVFVPVVPKLVPSSVFVPSRMGTFANLPS